MKNNNDFFATCIYSVLVTCIYHLLNSLTIHKFIKSVFSSDTWLLAAILELSLYDGLLLFVCEHVYSLLVILQF